MIASLLSERTAAAAAARGALWGAARPASPALPPPPTRPPHLIPHAHMCRLLPGVCVQRVDQRRRRHGAAAALRVRSHHRTLLLPPDHRSARRWGIVGWPWRMASSTCMDNHSRAAPAAAAAAARACTATALSLCTAALHCRSALPPVSPGVSAVKPMPLGCRCPLRHAHRPLALLIRSHVDPPSTVYTGDV